jgi:hypothetical protein
MPESNVFTAAGSVISIGDAAPASYDKAGFEAVTFTAVGEVTNIPEFGRLYSGVTHVGLAERGTVKRKGSFNDGSLTVQYAVDESDAGQSALEALIDSDLDQAVRIVLQSGKHIYFTTQIMSNPITIGTVNDIVSKSMMLEVVGQVLFEDAPV